MSKFDEPLIVDETLIRAAYRLMLHREPDNPASVEKAARYFKTVEQVEATLRNSAEWRAKQVQNFLQAGSQRTVRFQSERGFAIHLDLNDASVSGQIWFADDFEPHVEALLHDNVEWADAFVDVGANIGWFTMIVAHKMRALGTAGIVHAIEPNPRLAALLAASVVDAALIERVTVHGMAASNWVGMVDLWAPGQHAASSKILHDTWEQRAVARIEGTAAENGPKPGSDWSAEGQIGLHERIARVPAAPLDALLDQRKRRIGTIKLDVEGHEPTVLEGARQILAQDRPTLIIEINPPSLELSSGMGLADMVGRLGALGYSIRDPEDRDRSLDAEAIAARLGDAGYSDFLAKPVT